MAQLREAQNRVIIRGFLSEVDLDITSYTNKKTNAPVECIRGEIKVRTKVKIHDNEKELEIPVRLFANKYTREGSLSSLYESYENVKNEFTSIAAGGMEKADYIEVVGSVAMNEYVNRQGKFTSFITINGKFISKVSVDREPCAYCDLEAYYADSTDELGTDGTPTGRLQLIGIVPTWGGKVEVIPMICEKPSIIDGISQYWEPNETYPVRCALDFTSTSTVELVEQGIGDPIEKRRVSRVSDLIVISTQQVPLTEPLKYDPADIQAALDVRSANIEAMKNKRQAAPKKTLNLGF